VDPDRKQAIDKILSKLKKDYNFRPERKYRLQRRKPRNDEGSDKFQKKSTHEKLGMDTEWKRVRPARYLELPREPHVGKSIYEIRNKNSFTRYFENQFGDLPDGVYTALTSTGRGGDFIWLFVLQLEQGEVTWWKKKSNGTPYRNSSTYFCFPKYFQMRDDLYV
jgi:hypothetical protein